MKNKFAPFIIMALIFLITACAVPDSNDSGGNEAPVAGAQESGGGVVNIEPGAGTETAVANAAITGGTTGTEPPGTPALKPADADSPAAGICTDPPKDEFVTMTIRPDVPDPRCAKARRDQQLVLVNATAAPVQVSLGIFSATIQPGEEAHLDLALGEYLAPGVHFIQVSPPGVGGELWLIDQ